MYTTTYSRRRMLQRSASAAGLAAFAPLSNLFAREKTTYRVGVCDWSIGKHSDVEALAFAKELGLDGVQISLGTPANNMHLRQKKIQQAYLQAEKQTGVEVSSLAIGELNRVPYKSDPVTEEWVSDSIDVAKAMGCTVILLAFFSEGDIKDDKAGTQEVIRRLKKVAPKAEKQGIILGIESWLSANEHLQIIDAVGSPNVRVYYDVANSQKMGYDIYEEIARLGTEYICEIHAKENGYLLGQGVVDFKRVKDILDDIEYSGWIIMEGAQPEGMDKLETYTTNLQYIQSIFNKA
uniref:Sugar phosphate isomerase/epimerase n=1 Tax=Roseihalotalea indica TaxID=2867963 RepID=A0AA49GPH4_9BACT|nr:sugar phosphate isomerase/epimerase [Tunicatimonas sp. TK19036]